MLKLPSHKTMIVNASILKRILAFILDLLIINMIVVFPFQSVVERIIPVDSFESTLKYLSGTKVPFLLYEVMFVVTLLSILYFVLLERRIGQSLGKIFFNLYVMPIDKDTSTWRYVLRSIFLIPVFPFVLLWIIDPLYMLFNDQHQRLTEYLSKTKVVEKISW